MLLFCSSIAFSQTDTILIGGGRISGSNIAYFGADTSSEEGMSQFVKDLLYYTHSFTASTVGGIDDAYRLLWAFEKDPKKKQEWSDKWHMITALEPPLGMTLGVNLAWNCDWKFNVKNIAIKGLTSWVAHWVIYDGMINTIFANRPFLYGGHKEMASVVPYKIGAILFVIALNLIVD